VHSATSYSGGVVAPASTSSRLVPGIPESARLHVVTGKGGTGKTTVAAALAMVLAEGGRRTLLAEVEGRQSLAQLFDVPALPYKERRLATAPGGGEVMGLAVDAERALLEYLQMFYNLKRAARALRRMGAIDFATTLAPGVRDVLLTGKVKEAATRTGRDGRFVYDAVVLDAPPTGRIRQFLEATTEVANLTKAGPINRQSTGVLQLLHSTRTAVHIVTLLEEMPVQETVDAAAALAATGIPLGAVIVNRARPTLVHEGQVGTDGAVDISRLAHGLGAVGINAALAVPLATQLVEYADRQAVQAEHRARLASVRAPRIELPELTPPVDVGELIELGGYFVEEDR
jgi:anion-transporting  ArsA/GET3 family ATPase